MNLTKRTSFKQHLLLASLLFGLFFGAGNLIFPIHLGQMSGQNWVPATLGFVISAVLLPLFSILALSVTKSKSMYDMALPVGATFALLFLIAAHASMGLFIGSPRLATVSCQTKVGRILRYSFSPPYSLASSFTWPITKIAS